ncbi:hypothetical protein VPH35_078928 [Triticum aestivum]
MPFLRAHRAVLHRPSSPPVLGFAASEAIAPTLLWLLGRECCRTQRPRVFQGWIHVLRPCAAVGVLQARFLPTLRAGFVFPCQPQPVCCRLPPLRAPLSPSGRGCVLPVVVCGDGGRRG